MQFTFNIFLLIFSVGAIQGLVLSGLILGKKPQKRHNYYFGFLLLVFSLGACKIILQETVPDFLNMFRFPLMYKFACGPLLYWFVRELLHKNNQSFRSVAPHFIPVLLLDVLYRIGFHWFGFRNGDHTIQLINFSTDIAAIISYVIYGLLALRLWLRFTTELKGYGSVANKRILFWTKRLIVVDLLSTFTCMVYVLLTIYNEGYSLGGIRTYYIPHIAATLYIYFLCYLCYVLPEIEILSPKVKEQPGEEAVDYEPQKFLIRESILKNKYFTDPELTIQKLASSLHIPARDFSTIINKGFGQNFNDFINEFRVACFKELLLAKENSNYSIEGMAYEAGFKSKASFYRAFKKVSGQTPLQFQKEQAEILIK